MPSYRPTIKKQDFVDTLNFMKERDATFEKLIDQMEALTQGFYVDFLPNLSYNEQIIKLLNYLFKEEEDNSLIEYFIYETEYGTNADASTIEIDEKKYDISTPEKLYDVLCELKFPVKWGNNKYAN